MQFHDFLEAMLGSKVRIRVLRTLWRYPEKEFTVRELAKFLGISHTGIRKVLGDLEDMNVVSVRTLGRSFAFRLNVISYTSDIVGRMFEMEREALSELRKVLRGRLESPLVTSVALFGSIVEGKETPRSDVDLLIVTDRRTEVEDVVAELQKDVSERFGTSISAYYTSEKDLRKKHKEPPIKQALENHMLIFGKPLR